MVRWPAKRKNPGDWERWFAWYPVLVDYENGTSEWVWWGYVETRIIVREGGAWNREGRRAKT